MRLTRAAPARPTSIRTLPTVRPLAPLTSATSESRVFVFGGRRAAVRAVFFLAIWLSVDHLFITGSPRQRHPACCIVPRGGAEKGARDDYDHDEAASDILRAAVPRRRSSALARVLPEAWLHVRRAVGGFLRNRLSGWTGTSLEGSAEEPGGAAVSARPRAS